MSADTTVDDVLQSMYVADVEVWRALSNLSTAAVQVASAVADRDAEVARAVERVSAVGASDPRIHLYGVCPTVGRYRLASTRAECCSEAASIANQLFRSFGLSGQRLAIECDNRVRSGNRLSVPTGGLNEGRTQ